jgi:flagellar hook-length control protein FliK
MDISLANNLFLANGSTAKQSSVSKKSQKDSQSEDNFLLGSQQTDSRNNSTSVQKKADDETVSDFDAILAKKIAAKKIANQTAQVNSEEQNKEDTEKSITPQELTEIPAAQNVSLDAKVDTKVNEQASVTEDSVKAVADFSETDNKKLNQNNQSSETEAISQSTQKIDAVNEKIDPTDEQNTEITKDSIDANPIENKEQLTENDKNLKAQPQTIEKPTENIINIPEITDQQKAGKAEEAKETKEPEPALVMPEETSETKDSQKITNNQETQVPEIEKPKIQNPEQNQQIPEQTGQPSIQNTTEVQQNNQKNTESIISSDETKSLSDNVKTKTSEETTDQQKQDFSDQQSFTDQLSSQTEVKDTQADNSFINNLQPAISSQTQTNELPNNQTTKANTVASSVGVQIQDSIQSTLSTDNKEIVIQLNPPDLGKVQIKFTEENNSLIGVLSVDKSHTKNEIQQTLPEVIQNLQDSGINIKKIEVVLSNNQEQQTMKDQSSMSGQNWFGQQNQSNQDSHRSGNIYSQWTFSSDSSMSQSYEPAMQFSGSSINMLA